MSEAYTIHPIAHIQSDFAEKFGIPRQSGLVEDLEARVVFTPDCRVAEALRGIEQYSHLWLVWQFSQAAGRPWHPTVRPPRLGGNVRMGVFATRSPFRPNPIGLSCVRLEKIEHHPQYGPVLWVAGADLMDGSPIYDIKPYIPYADCRPEAAGGFASQPKEPTLRVECPPELLARVPEPLREALLGVLAQDPRPQYQHRPDRVYGLSFGGLEIKFTVEEDCLTVRQVEPSP